MTNVLACIDGTSITPRRVRLRRLGQPRMDAPLVFLHVLDKSEYPIESDLSGNIGLGSREALLEELAALDESAAGWRWSRDG
jgi:hypothetical protein